MLSPGNDDEPKELRKISGGKIPSQATMDSAVASLERARADLLSAEASVHQQEAQVQITETDLSKTIIRSPTKGVVLSRKLEPGQTVAASFTTPELFVIAEDLASMLLEVSIAEADIGFVKDGQVARFQVDAWPQRTYEATVSKVSFGSKVTDNVVTYPTELKVANADLSLRPGMTATADIDVAHHTDVFLVPVAALRFEPMEPAENGESGEEMSFLEKMIMGPSPQKHERREGYDGSDPSLLKPAIWVLRDGEPQRVVVMLGLSNGQMTEVSSADLSIGDAVIIREELAKR
ncbi:efflux RND transporter periplasmic adaptor subunit [Puniceicoccus vermicola]|uniref:Efflux RND transporter periplasmic adaptor subunit n=1 Tax=Puniceicoccus vermicola TaxID=388746 RepID=A0A7X1B137_9BACT|nr:efflux RND transporter periplasmic adaptor subunit [Puniceicoccus vermicola]MBC2602550.1 efflux RND transporter periplasmic adaptor subunit [Puniceicoccus vermicola]